MAVTRSSIGTYAVALAGLVIAVLLLLPAEAQAQYTPTPWGSNDDCRDEGPQGRGRGQDSRNNLTVALDGAGVVTPWMYNTQADCIDTIPFGAPRECTFSCAYEVQTVCEFHCLHDHTAPFHWTVQVVPQASAGTYFLGWLDPINCAPIKDVPRSTCVVRMNTDQIARARFGPAPDSTQPTPPTLSASPGSYSATLAWSPSSDDYLAGYDIYKNGALLARAPKNSTSFQVENLFCQTGYSLQVRAFDTVHEAPSNTVSIVTGACSGQNLSRRPNTVIHVKPPRSTRSRTAFFHFGTRGTVRASRYQCRLDRGAWTRCSGVTGKRYRNLRAALHTFRVRAGNAAGYDRTAALYTWRVRR